MARRFFGDRALIAASRKGDEQVVDLLLNSNSTEAHLLTTDDAETGQGMTALMWAVFEGHIQIVKRLLQHHPERQLLACTHYFYTPSLMWAFLAADREEMVDLWLNSNSTEAHLLTTDNYGETALTSASCEGHIQIVKRLLQYHPEILLLALSRHGYTPLMWAVLTNREEMVDLLLNSNSTEAHLLARNYRGETALMRASDAGHIHIVKRLLQHHPESQLLARSLDGLTPLMWAVQADSEEVVEALLDYIPEQQLLARDSGVETSEGMTALMWASNEGHSQFVKPLLQYHPEKQLLALGGFDYGLTPLMWAVDADSEEVVEALLDYIPEQQLLARSEEGMTALMIACKRGRIKVVKRLLEHHPESQLLARVHDNHGYTPLMWTVKIGSDKVVKVKALLNYIPEQQLRARSKQGETALVIACESGRIQTVKLLLDSLPVGKYLKPDGTVDRTPMDCAKSQGIVQLLKTSYELSLSDASH